MLSISLQGHLEAVYIEYDSNQITYSELLDIFYAEDMLKDAGQYSSCIFANTEEQARLAEEKRITLSAIGDHKANIPIIKAFSEEKPFFIAESCKHRVSLHTFQVVCIILKEVFV